MFRVLFLLFLVVPIVEISILIQLSEVIGGWTTILLVVMTAYLGAKMVKQQGLATLAKIKQKSAMGQIPGEELFNGVCILISGVLLLTPGILTDVLGFGLLTPMVRKKMIAVLKQKVHLFAANSAQSQSFTFTSTDFESNFSQYDADATQQGHSPRVERDLQGNNVIEGEFQRHDELAEKNRDIKDKD